MVSLRLRKTAVGSGASRIGAIALLVVSWTATANAQNVEPPPAPDPTPVAPSLRTIDIHGFISEGGFLSTANDYIGTSSRGSLELFEVGLNVSTEVADRLRAGVQLFSRNEGTFQDVSPHVDWAFLDYRWKPWLGLRAGIIKMPFGLYNEYTDVDAARVPILMPQSIYPIRERDLLLGHRGFSVYGNQPIGSAGELDYQAWFGALIVPENALVLHGASLDSIDSRYVAGVQAFWHTPIEGLRTGFTFARAAIDFHVTLDPDSIAQLMTLGLVPADFSGAVLIAQRPDTLVIGSAEYVTGDWLFAAEYARSLAHQRTSLPDVFPTVDSDGELYYAMAAYRLSSHFAASGYYSASYADVHDRHGHDPKYAQPFDAFQRDYAATLRFDVNDHWLWKLEAHLMDGVAELDLFTNPSPSRYWGMFLFRTTVTF